MAIKKTIEIEIKDNVNVTTDHFEDLNDEIKAVKKQADDLSKSFENNGDAIEKSFKPLKTQFREAQQQVAELSEKFGATSKEAINAAKRAAELKDAIADAKDLTDAFNPDAKFNALSNSIGGVLNGFQAFEGTLGLIGVESESVQETLLKVQSAMALSQGIQGLMEAKDSFKQLGAVAVDALKGIKTGIASTGIGLFVVALGTIYAYWDDIKEAVNGVSKQQENLNVLTHANVESENHKKQILESQDNILKLQGKTEEQILKLKVAQTNEQIKAIEAVIKQDEITLKAQVAAEKRNFDYLRAAYRIGMEVGVLAFRAISAPFDLLITAYNKIAPALNLDKIEYLNKKITDLTEYASGKVASFVFDPEEVKAKGEQAIAESKKTLLSLKNERAGYLLSLKDVNKKENEIELTNKKEDVKKIVEETKNHYKELQDLEDERFKLHQEATYSEQELEIARLIEQYDKKFEIANGNAELEKELETKLRQEIADINAKYNNHEVEETKKTEDKKVEILKATEQQKLQAVKDGFTTIGNLAQLFAGQSEEQQKKSFKIQKAANIANTLIDTYSSATASYKSLAGIPAIGPALGIAAAAAAVTAGLANVRNIAQQEFNSSSSGGGGNTTSASSTATQPAPSFNIVGNGNIGQLASLNQAPIQAYVVSGEVTSQQALDRNRLRNATF